MSRSRRRLVSAVCLLAYLVASAPGYVTSALWQPCDAECHACAEAKSVDACSTRCFAAKNQAEHECLATDRCKGVCGVVSPSGTTLATPSENQKQGPGCPSDSACPDGCFLCNAAGSVPLPITPAPILEGLKYLGAVNTGTFLFLCQPHPDELIRPPMR